LWSSGLPEEGEPRYSIFVGDKDGREKDRLVALEAWMPHIMVKNPVGQSGGLALFWKRDVNLRIVGFMSNNHIDAEITEVDGFVWRFTGTYGDPHTEGKTNTWMLLRTLKHQNNKPWLMAGDFNEILHA
jgi:hypothetical protein